ncbi:hypothetical protein HDU92_001750 [Lobulomyces angularis]|nr:hypothetical protein HDU92_001750 [Lobulomyces angularis]
MIIPENFTFKGHNEEGEIVFTSEEYNRSLSLKMIKKNLIKVQVKSTTREFENKKFIYDEKYKKNILRKKDLTKFQVLKNKNFTLLEFQDLKIKVNLPDLNIQWSSIENGKEFTFLEDLPFKAYPFEKNYEGCFHFMKKKFNEFCFGGEHPSPLCLNNRRFRMDASDALGYDAEKTDPLYKVTPFFLTLLKNEESNSTFSYAIFYDSLQSGYLDFGNEIEAFLGPYKYYCLNGTDQLDYYVIVGGDGETGLKNIYKEYSSLIGQQTLPPRYSFGYLASSMGYAESENAQEMLINFSKSLKFYDIPCDLLYLSSGYTVDKKNGARNVFTWNHDRFSDPKKFFSELNLKVVANIKPWLLDCHPDYGTVKTRRGFLMKEDNVENSTTRLWSAGEGATGKGSYLDFTSISAREYWKEGVTNLLKLGCEGIWNDNNEYSITNGDVLVSMEVFKEENFLEVDRLHSIKNIGKSLQTILMAKYSYDAILEHNNFLKRPFLVSRSSSPGVQKYASSTWSGDNITSWHTLKHNIPMGLGAQLALMPMGYGHDVGGFVGARPDRELFVRWVQQGILQPRFCIHSWKSEGITEPWMYEDVLHIVRDAIKFRYKLIPYLYSVAYETHYTGIPIARPLFFEFPNDHNCILKSFEYFLGKFILVASIIEPSLNRQNFEFFRKVYLPQGSNYFDYNNKVWYSGGKEVEVKVSFNQFGALFVREGSIIPLGNENSSYDIGDVKVVLVYPPPNAVQLEEEFFSEFKLYEDDGECFDLNLKTVLNFKLKINKTSNLIELGLKFLSKDFEIKYNKIRFLLPREENRKVTVFFDENDGYFNDDQISIGSDTVIEENRCIEFFF